MLTGCTLDPGPGGSTQTLWGTLQQLEGASGAQHEQVMQGCACHLLGPHGWATQGRTQGVGTPGACGQLSK